MDLKNVNEFLAKHNFIQPDVKEFTRDLLIDMWNGLVKTRCRGENDSGESPADQPMIIVPRSVPEQIPANSSAIIIDAGGTNFRSCLVTSDSEGKVSISELRKTSMPAIKEQLSKKQFYNAIADNIEYLKDKASRIGFCFSYAMEMNDEGDGKVLVFSKEINAPEVIGTYVGRELKATLEEKGWKSIEKISLVNDTMACLLAGTVQPDSKKYDSFAGFILGTGINNAYLEPKLDSKIVVCECGMYGKVPQSDFDVTVDETSVNKGKSKLEKMCSGAYLGQVAMEMLRAAGNEGLFSEAYAADIKKRSSLSMIEIGEILNSETENPINNADMELVKFFLKSVIQRSARLVAGVLAATIISSGKGETKEKSVCVVCNGTTFWKTLDLANQAKDFLDETLTGEWQRYYEIRKIEDDITFGTYAAAF